MARTTLDLDEELIQETVRESGKNSKTAAIEEAMREFINARKRERLIEMIGSGAIDMTLDELWKMRGCDEARAANERNPELPD
jgi:Arc/MetJ family transcription regulator